MTVHNTNRNSGEVLVALNVFCLSFNVQMGNKEKVA